MPHSNVRGSAVAFVLSLVVGIIGSASADNVLAYHNGAARSGAYVVPGLTLAAAHNLHLDSGFRAKVSGHVYAQPLFFHPAGGRSLLIVATESNAVVALDAKTGATVWQRTLGSPVARSSIPCGNVDPDGITGTPVIDPAKSELYLDALTGTRSGPRHLVYALSLKDGSVVYGYPLDVAAALEQFHLRFSSTTQGERGALSFLGGALYVPYGGNWGDCGTYRGTVIQIDPEHAKLSAVWQTRANGGGIWAPGGLASDGTSLFAVTGNTFGASQYADGEAIVRLKPNLAHSNDTADYFAPQDWKELDDGDRDLGGTDALPIDVGGAARLIAFGKDGKAYLVDRSRLGGIGGALAIARVSDNAIITAPAVLHTNGTMVVFTSRGGGRCASDNVTMLDVGANALKVAWCAPFDGAGAPIVTTTDGSANAIVWVTGAEGDNRLHGFDATSGKPVFTGGGATMSGLRHMGTLIAAEGRLYVAADSTVYAFAFK